MSEEQIKEKHKVLRIVSTIELSAGIATFLCGLLIVLLVWWSIIAHSGVRLGGLDVFMFFLLVVGVSSIVLFWPITVIGLVLSIVALFIERDVRSRLLPLAFVLAGILIYILCYALLHIDLL